MLWVTGACDSVQIVLVCNVSRTIHHSDANPLQQVHRRWYGYDSRMDDSCIQRKMLKEEVMGFSSRSRQLNSDNKAQWNWWTGPRLQRCWKKRFQCETKVLALNNLSLWFRFEMKIFQRPCWNYFRAIKRVTTWVCMARHVIVNLLHPFTERIFISFQDETTCWNELFHCKKISH